MTPMQKQQTSSSPPPFLTYHPFPFKQRIRNPGDGAKHHPTTDLKWRARFDPTEPFDKKPDLEMFSTLCHISLTTFSACLRVP